MVMGNFSVPGRLTNLNNKMAVNGLLRLQWVRGMRVVLTFFLSYFIFSTVSGRRPDKD